MLYKYCFFQLTALFNIAQHLKVEERRGRQIEILKVTY